MLIDATSQTLLGCAATLLSQEVRKVVSQITVLFTLRAVERRYTRLRSDL